MIIVRLTGGLGNQLFQYALGRRLALDRDIPLKLDLSWFEDPAQRGADTSRDYDLSNFRIVADIASKEELESFASNSWRRLLRFFRLGQLAPRIRERGYEFDPTVFGVPRDALLEGCWQSEKYFLPITDVLRKEIVPRGMPNRENADMQQQIAATTSVSVHVRRGDYATNPITNAFHGICSLSYYERAVDSLTSRLVDPQFFVFSDDPDWCLKTLHFPGPVTWVRHNTGRQSYLDLWLMRHCKHHIIANSSFSWWGAWLASNDDKLVIAPARWFNQEGIATSDLIPPGWIRLES